jgi:hypothetical protein
LVNQGQFEEKRPRIQNSRLCRKKAAVLGGMESTKQNFVPVCAAVTDSAEFYDAPVKLKGKIQNIIEILDDKIIW